jgi:hypothetical protein
VRAAPLVVQLRRLATWLGPQRTLTRSGLPRLSEARELCTHLDLPVPDRPQPRKASDIPALGRIWDLAQECDFVTAVGAEARPGQAAVLLDDAQADAEELLGLWSALLEEGLESGPGFSRDNSVAELDEHAPDLVHDIVDAVDTVLLTTLGVFYSQVGDPPSLLELEKVALAAVAEECPLDTYRKTITPAQRDELTTTFWREYVELLVELGAITIDGNDLVMTALGRAGFRLLLVKSGVDAPLVEEVAERDAAGLLVALSYATEDVEEKLITAWLSARPRQTAATELIATARTASAGDRFSAVGLLSERLGEYLHGDGLAQIESLRDDPMLWPYVDLLLHGDGATITPAQRQWLTLDAVAVLLDTGELDDEPGRGEPDDELWDAVTTFADLETAWRCAHPQLLDVLQAIIDNHPTGRVRKAAKKALFKARQS